jgi:hypothetical protein
MWDGGVCSSTGLQVCLEWGDPGQSRPVVPLQQTVQSGGQVKLSLSLAERTYHCEVCGLEIDRDFNAALNLRQLATARSAGDDGLANVQACGQLAEAGL